MGKSEWFFSGLFIGGLMLMIILGTLMRGYKTPKELVKHNCMEYHNETGVLEWITKGK